jgi:hypothetical protein
LKISRIALIHFLTLGVNTEEGVERNLVVLDFMLLDEGILSLACGLDVVRISLQRRKSAVGMVFSISDC